MAMDFLENQCGYCIKKYEEYNKEVDEVTKIVAKLDFKDGTKIIRNNFLYEKSKEKMYENLKYVTDDELKWRTKLTENDKNTDIEFN